jgi:hypothetical protein
LKREIVRLFGARAPRIGQTPMKECNDVGNLVFAEFDGRHAFVGPAVSNHRTNKIAAVIMVDQRGTNQIRSFGSPGSIRRMTKTAGLRKLCLTALRRLRWRQILIGCVQRPHHREERNGDPEYSKAGQS